MELCLNLKKDSFDLHLLGMIILVTVLCKNGDIKYSLCLISTALYLTLMTVTLIKDLTGIKQKSITYEVNDFITLINLLGVTFYSITNLKEIFESIVYSNMILYVQTASIVSLSINSDRNTSLIEEAILMIKSLRLFFIYSLTLIICYSFIIFNYNIHFLVQLVLKCVLLCTEVIFMRKFLYSK